MLCITKTVVAVLWIMPLCLTTLFEKILNFNVDTFDNCLSDVHCPITLSLHAVNTNNIPNNVQPHDDEVVAGC